ncbi:hypothetical protein BC830DRAFT_1113889 [Chytriomyces sp. MP71]|nr:hypothetical protein BC830DRAFT_1113889 [Chytriomyces sp. MP71]
MTIHKKDDRFFTQNWTIRVPVHSRDLESNAPSGCVVVKNVNESNAQEWIDSQTFVPMQAEKDVRKENLLNQCVQAKSRHDYMEVIAYLEPAPGSEPTFIGFGELLEIPSTTGRSTANAGICIESDVRGRGLGTLLFLVLLRLACELDLEVIEAGTMKENQGMRALARKLGLAETEEIKLHPNGSGAVVADVMFNDIDVHGMLSNGAFADLDIVFQEFE